jgi:CRISPR-associated exonuclease Cas4
MTEDIVAMAFSAAGFNNYDRQVEIAVEGDVPLKAHIDFVFTSKPQKIKSVLEIKSTSKIPDGPYGSWESQLYIQMGALASKYPDYTIKGAVMALDLADGNVGFFNGYKPEETIFNGLLDRAGAIWSEYQNMLNGEEVYPDTETGPLCGFCNHITTCPRFEGEEVPQLENVVEALQEQQAKEKVVKGEIKLLKRNLLAVVEQKGPIKTGGCLLKKATRSRKYLDTDRLENFLTESGVAIEEYQKTNTFSFLEIRKAKAA